MDSIKDEEFIKELESIKKRLRDWGTALNQDQYDKAELIVISIDEQIIKTKKQS